jgi:hypothetical protein
LDRSSQCAKEQLQQYGAISDQESAGECKTVFETFKNTIQRLVDPPYLLEKRADISHAIPVEHERSDVLAMTHHQDSPLSRPGLSGLFLSSTSPLGEHFSPPCCEVSPAYSTDLQPPVPEVHHPQSQSPSQPRVPAHSPVQLRPRQPLSPAQIVRFPARVKLFHPTIKLSLSSVGTDRGRRTRRSNACFACRSAKLRCDGAKPCGQCNRKGELVICDYAQTVRRRGKGKKAPFVEALKEEEVGEAEGADSVELDSM